MRPSFRSSPFPRSLLLLPSSSSSSFLPSSSSFSSSSYLPSIAKLGGFRTGTRLGCVPTQFRLGSWNPDRNSFAEELNICPKSFIQGGKTGMRSDEFRLGFWNPDRKWVGARPKPVPTQNPAVSWNPNRKCPGSDFWAQKSELGFPGPEIRIWTRPTRILESGPEVSGLGFGIQTGSVWARISGPGEL